MTWCTQLLQQAGRTPRCSAEIRWLSTTCFWTHRLENGAGERPLIESMMMFDTPLQAEQIEDCFAGAAAVASTGRRCLCLSLRGDGCVWLGTGNVSNVMCAKHWWGHPPASRRHPGTLLLTHFNLENRRAKTPRNKHAAVPYDILRTVKPTVQNGTLRARQHEGANAAEQPPNPKTLHPEPRQDSTPAPSHCRQHTHTHLIYRFLAVPPPVGLLRSSSACTSCSSTCSFASSRCLCASTASALRLSSSSCCCSSCTCACSCCTSCCRSAQYRCCSASESCRLCETHTMA